MSTPSAIDPGLDQTELLHSADGGKRTELRAFLNWIACWLVLPNLPFLPITLMGGPPRYPDILVCGVAGLIGRRMNYAGRSVLFIALMAFLVIDFIARMFNMAITMILSVIGLVFDMRPAASIEYVVGTALLAITVAAALWLLRQRDQFEQPKWLIAAIAATLALAASDYLASKDAMGSYSRLPNPEAPFTSATSQADFLSLADGKTNLMVVVVEAMGEPQNPAMRARLDRIWMRPEFMRSFEITHGVTEYYGSTTSGEVRELCHRWGNYDEITAPEPHCLPALLEKRGYETTSYHAFKANFFDRERWYPLIGFRHMVFGDQLLAKGAGYCPNVFPGACDRDVPGFISKRLANADKPQFIYWLTLNSHLPVVANSELGTEDCAGSDRQADEDFPMICRLFTIWRGTADALANVIDRPDFPPTDILIVGDHMPPFTDQKTRLQFDPAHVPWILLKHRGPQTVAHKQTVALN